jgi:hypothetical protein
MIQSFRGSEDIDFLFEQQKAASIFGDSRLTQWAQSFGNL